MSLSTQFESLFDIFLIILQKTMESPITLDGIIVGFGRVEFHLARPRIVQVTILTWEMIYEALIMAKGSTLAVGQPGDSRASGCPSRTNMSPPQNRKSSALKEALNQGSPVKTSCCNEKSFYGTLILELFLLKVQVLQ